MRKFSASSILLNTLKQSTIEGVWHMCHTQRLTSLLALVPSIHIKLASHQDIDDSAILKRSTHLGMEVHRLLKVFASPSSVKLVQCIAHVCPAAAILFASCLTEQLPVLDCADFPGHAT